jgi:hypothetical protein
VGVLPGLADEALAELLARVLAELLPDGKLLIPGVLDSITNFNGTALFQGRAVRLQARTAFKFGEFDLTQPRIFRVLSIEDLIRLEVDLTLRQAS